MARNWCICCSRDGDISVGVVVISTYLYTSAKPKECCSPAIWAVCECICSLLLSRRDPWAQMDCVPKWWGWSGCDDHMAISLMAEVNFQLLHKISKCPSFNSDYYFIQFSSKEIILWGSWNTYLKYFFISLQIDVYLKKKNKTTTRN